EAIEKLRPRFGDVAGTHDDDHVAVAHLGRENVRQRGTIAAPRELATFRAECLRDEIGGHPCDRCLARGIDVREKYQIAGGQGAGELAREITRAREQMRLKREDESPPGESGT